MGTPTWGERAVAKVKSCFSAARRASVRGRPTGNSYPALSSAVNRTEELTITPIRRFVAWPSLDENPQCVALVQRLFFAVLGTGRLRERKPRKAVGTPRAALKIVKVGLRFAGGAKV